MAEHDPAAGMTGPDIGNEDSRVIMLVDDEETNLEHLAMFFEQRGLRVRAYTSAAEALKEAAEGFRPALVVTDYSMPGMDGITFLESLRRIMPDVRSVMLTAHGSVDTYIRSFSLGVFEYVNKPVDEREFDRVVRSALKRAERP